METSQQGTRVKRQLLQSGWHTGLLTTLDRVTVPGGIPEAKGRATQTYTIANITTYRDIAMDLDPERVRIGDGNRNNTADPDWYLNYMQNSIYGVFEEVTDRVAQQTDIKNYKGKL